jgi:hypothetical protein
MMSSTVLQKSETRWNNTMKWLVAVTLVIALVVIALMLTQAESATSAANETNAGAAPVVAPSVGIQAPQAPDIYAAQLDQLRRMAVNVAGLDGPTAHVYTLETLAQIGREAQINGSAMLGSTAGPAGFLAPDIYAAQLDQLRRMAINAAGWDGPTAFAYSLEALAQIGREVQTDGMAAIRRPVLIAGSPAPDVYTTQIDQLRRFAINAAGWDGPTIYAYSLAALAQAGREAQLTNQPDPNAFSESLDELRRLDQ